jgi:hypothetical protein
MNADRRSISELTLTSDWLLSKVEDRLLISAVSGYLPTQYFVSKTNNYHLSNSNKMSHFIKPFLPTLSVHS